MKKSGLIVCLSVFILSQTMAQVTIEPVWVRVGDSYGKIDVENEIESIECAVFSPDEKTISSGAKKGWDIILWDVKTGEKIWQDKATEEIEVVDFTLDGKLLVTSHEDGTLRLWRINFE